MRYAAAVMALAIGAGLMPAAFAQSAGPNPPPNGGGDAAPRAGAPAAVTPAPDQAAAEAAPTVKPEPGAQAEAAPAGQGETGERHGHAPGDPWEGFNRGVFGFNEALDKHFMEPVAKGYRAVTPRFFRSGVTNFLHNLNSPVIFANDVLQASPARAGTTAGRFLINSTVGIGGVFDVAKHAGLESHDEDFGQTLGKWGVGGGPFLMLPLLGPSNIRDGVGKGVDIAFDPLTYVKFNYDDTFRIVRVSMDLLSQRTDAIDAIDAMRQTSIDPYATTRSAYNQSRASAIANGESAEDSPDSTDTLSQ